MSSNTIYYCSHCGEKCSGKYCRMCATAAGRAEVDRLNADIRQENIAKGYSYVH